jgi:hypothetical protein
MRMTRRLAFPSTEAWRSKALLRRSLQGVGGSTDFTEARKENKVFWQYGFVTSCFPCALLFEMPWSRSAINHQPLAPQRAGANEDYLSTHLSA